MASTVWKGHLTFGLVSFPVRLYSAARGESISFNQLHKTDGSRIKQMIYCVAEDKPIPRSEIVKGYEYEKDRYVVVEDCGRVINPAIVDGQIRGGVAQGIGQVLYERAAYDDEGNFLAGTFMDYLLPTAAEIPTIEIEHVESDPDGEIGFRGVGEGGMIVAPAALTNAIEDALLPFGAKVTEQYLPPAKVLKLAGII